MAADDAVREPPVSLPRSYSPIVFLLALAGASISCDRVGEPDIEPDGGPDADTDTDSDTDTDADTDTDTDTDVDTDSGSDPYECAGGRFDPSSGLCWQHPMASGTYHWQEAMDYCDNLDLAGHSDWYLPARQDLVDLLGGCDYWVTSGGSGTCNTCASSSTCSALLDVDTECYWSSSHLVVDWDEAWYAIFDDGTVGYTFKTASRFIRCVRIGPLPAATTSW
jgi:hypothetical protein